MRRRGRFGSPLLRRRSGIPGKTRPLAVYQLLSGAHYRTSPLDLRRMMDAPGQHFLGAFTAERVAVPPGWWKRADYRSR